MAKICIDLGIDMEGADSIAGALDSFQEYQKELNIDADMRTVVFNEKNNGVVEICGDDEELREFASFIRKVGKIRKLFQIVLRKD